MNEMYSEIDIQKMKLARETGKIQTAHTPDTWIFYPPNREVMKFEKGLFAESECWHTVEEIIILG